MYAFNNRLGQAPDSFEGIMTPRGVPSGDFSPGKSGWLAPELDVSDPDLISIAYYSPDSGYPPQRISNYDLPLAEHETLNGINNPNAVMMKLPAYNKGFLGSIGRVQLRKLSMRPMVANVLTPRHETAMFKQTLLTAPPVKAGQVILQQTRVYPRKLSMRRR